MYDVANLRPQNGVTPLHLAIENDHQEAAALLLADPRIDVNIYDRVGTMLLCFCVLTSPSLLSQELRTALHLAANNGRSRITQLLLEDANLQPNIVSLVRLPTLHFKCFLNAVQDGRSPLHFATANGHAHDVHALVADHRVDVNLRDQVRMRMPFAGQFMLLILALSERPHCLALRK